MILNEFFNNKQFENNSFGNSEPEQQQMDADRRGRLGRERNAGLDEPDDVASEPVQKRNGVYEYTVPAGQESTAQELGLQQHRGHWVSRVPIQRANFQFGRPQFHEIPTQGVAEGKEDKIAQLKKDHATAVHWSKNEKSPQKREAARQKAEKIKRHLETQYKQDVAEGLDGQVVFSGTGADGGTYEIIQSSPTDFMIHANGKHIDTYSSLQRAMSVLKNEVPGLTKGVAEGLNEMDKSAPQPGRDGKVSHSTYGSRDKKGSDYFKGKEAPGKPITKKQMEKHALDILKKQGVAEESSENKYSNLSNRGVNRGINRAGDDFNRMLDLDQAESPHYTTQHQRDTKQRLKTKPMTGPKGVLPEQDVAEANIQPTSAASRSHIGNLSNPVTNSVVHPSSGKEIGLITMQPTGEYYAQPTSTALANSQGGTFATKDEAHQFIRNAHAKAIKNGTLSDKWLKKQPLPQFAKGQGVAEGMLDNPGEQDSPAAQAIIRRILLQRTDLLSKYGPEKVGQAVDEVADFVGDVDEIGSSDVSGWVKHVEQMLGNMGEQGVAENSPVDSDGYSVDQEDAGEYDYEGDQAKDQLQTIMAAARKLNSILDDNENLPEWVQMKITKATDYLDTAADYVAANKAQSEPMAETKPEKIGGVYDPVDFDAKLGRMKARHQQSPSDFAALTARLQAAYKKPESNKKPSDSSSTNESRQARRALMHKILKG